MTEKRPYKKSTVLYQLKTFMYAFHGIKEFFLNETKSVVHLIAMIVTIAAGILFEISIAEWLMIIFAIGIVFISEILNSAIERTIDLIVPQRNQTAGQIKDLGAAAVLIASITSLIIGLLIFIPKILELL